MKLTTLCYIEADDCFLMLHRIKKKQDINKGKWIGVGGHFEPGESPEECILRETREETGLTLTGWQFRGLVTFVNTPGDQSEYMCLYTADRFDGELTDCQEGVLKWIPKSEVMSLPLWDGDRIFLRLLADGQPFFSLKLCYEQDQLREAFLDGKRLELFDIRRPDGSCTGEVKERTLAHLDGSLHGTAHIWIVRRLAAGKFEVLLQKRSTNKDAHPGCFDTSSAGHLSAGQDFEEAALREQEEELGISAQATDLAFVGYHHGYCEDTFYGKPFRNREISTVYVYEKPLDTDSLQLQEAEVESVCWMPFEEVLNHVKAADPLYCMYEDELAMVLSYMEETSSEK
ncbi:MAG: NUDIX domain-containing protein [Lachnospiraceae bacterium]|nr:NUDIX domain-containing protein [Lachnospiraceae bacterium]